MQYDSAYLSWDTGNYVDALNRLQRVLTGPDGDRFFEPAALLTGELFHTTEIAPPNQYVVAITGTQAPKWSPDGRNFAFESSLGPVRTIHAYHWANGDTRLLARVNGYSVSFSADASKIVFLRVVEDDELRAARAAAAAAGGRGGRAGGGGATAALEAAKAVVVVRDIAADTESVLPTPGITRESVMFGPGDQIFVTGVKGSGEAQVFRVGGNEPQQITTSPGAKRVLASLAGNKLLVGIGNASFGILDPATRDFRTYDGTSFTASASGSHIVFLSRVDSENAVAIVSARASEPPVIVKRTTMPLANPVVSPDGRRVIFQMTPREDSELYLIDADGKNEKRITREIQHDHTPRFLTSTRAIGLIGENRHRRSYVYDLENTQRTRLFHNNQIRTVSMEYFWAPSPDGSRVLIVSDRDGDTISPERGVYVIDLGTKIDKADLVVRIDSMKAAETRLRERGRLMFAPIAGRIRTVLQEASTPRVYANEKALYEFDSKYITQPGNQKAAEYIYNTLKSYGYEPEYQWFEPRPGVRTANVIVTLRGTVNPELLYVVSSHYDSVERGPGADDDTSGACALLEAARLLAGKPLAATIKFAWFTGEEAGLLGSREFVRRAVESGDKIVGALNNDMIGWANDHRLDNTIRYSNAGLRDLQHAAAFQFTNLITYDSRYYQSTDAQAYFDAYGDIVGGIGSYPILGNPHYHQSHDQLETINHQLVTEVAKTTVASLMLMASSPSRLKDLTAQLNGTGVQVRWTPAPETGVRGYLVAYGPANDPTRKTVRVNTPTATLADAKAGDAVWVKAVSNGGFESWDWAKVIVQ